MYLAAVQVFQGTAAATTTIDLISHESVTDIRGNRADGSFSFQCFSFGSTQFRLVSMRRVVLISGALPSVFLTAKFRASSVLQSIAAPGFQLPFHKARITLAPPPRIFATTCALLFYPIRIARSAYAIASLSILSLLLTPYRIPIVSVISFSSPAADGFRIRRVAVITDSMITPTIFIPAVQAPPLLSPIEKLRR